MTAHVCIITSGHLATNPRVVKEATALHGAGYKVSVVHGDYIPEARAIDASLAGDWMSMVAAPFGPRQASRPRYLLQTLQRRGARIAARAFPHSARQASLAGSAVSSGLSRAAANIRADLYIAHYLPALPAAAHAAARNNAVYAFDAEDFHIGDLPDEPGASFDRRLIRTVEGRYLPGTAYISAASPGIAAAYAETYGVNFPAVVLNTFPKAQAPAAPTAAGAAAPAPTLYWFSQTIGPDRGLECAVAAIAGSKASASPAFARFNRRWLSPASYGDSRHTWRC